MFISLRLQRRLCFSASRASWLHRRWTLAELREIRLRGAHGETIPTLAEVASIFRGTPIRLRLEIKSDPDRRLYPGIAPRVLKVLEEENGRLKRLLADAMLDNAVLKEVAGKNW